MTDNEVVSQEVIDADRQARSSSWFIPNDKLTLSPFAQELFQKYSGVPEGEVSSHIINLREKAWKVHPYPCLGGFRFTDFAILESPAYNTVVERTKAGAKYLDLGCCFAQDLRALVYAGVPSENLYGADLQSGFIELSYDLFKDQDTLKSTFFTGDIFDLSTFKPAKGDTSDPELFHKLMGQFEILSARSFLHLFNQELEFKAACNMVKMVSEKKGSIIMGRQSGSRKAGFHETSSGLRTIWRHDAASFKELWKRVAEATGTEWDVQANLVEITPYLRTMFAHVGLKDSGDRVWLEFVITRL
ncbi:hypothetical protein TWF694_010037 [Orbilia ellipsospora]|uniref:Methyltransferase domain-containing protein n=1 Tax=Orbilia ellipsospora TaxID=2528407 RepID=A0AAV9X9X0_9PEZI